MEHDASLAGARLTELARRIDRPVALVGLMGVGKSSVGRKLAALLAFPFIDADEEIERAAQMSVGEIFERFGEPYFRDGERRVIARLIGDGGVKERKVIATGGGAFADPETRALILDKAIAVWLDSDLETLLERVGRRDHRPLLRTGDPRAILTKLRAEREPAYSQAPIHVASATGPPRQTVDAIIAELARWQ